MRWSSILVDSASFSLKCALCTLLPMLGGCVFFAPQVRPLSKPVEAHFEMRQGAMLIAVPSKPGSYFLFDTGTTFCHLDPGAFPNLSYDIVIDLSFGLGPQEKEGVREVYPAPHVNVGPFDIADYPGCESMDLKGLSQLVGVPVVGVFGSISYYGGTLQIDFNKSVIRILPSDGKEHPEWGERRPMENGNCALFNVSGHNLPLIVDTGDNYFMAASPSLVSALRQTADTREGSANCATVIGVSNRKVLGLKRLTIDGRTYSDSAIWEASDTTSTLGTGFLRNFIVTMDCSRGYLYLKPANPPTTSTTAISSEK
jgi:hypothetical protein